MAPTVLCSHNFSHTDQVLQGMSLDYNLSLFEVFIGVRNCSFCEQIVVFIQNNCENGLKPQFLHKIPHLSHNFSHIKKLELSIHHNHMILFMFLNYLCHTSGLNGITHISPVYRWYIWFIWKDPKMGQGFVQLVSHIFSHTDHIPLGMCVNYILFLFELFIDVRNYSCCEKMWFYWKITGKISLKPLFFHKICILATISQKTRNLNYSHIIIIWRHLCSSMILAGADLKNITHI